MGERTRRVGLYGGLLLASLPVAADWTVNMPEGVTRVSRSVFDLHMLIFWICVAIAVAVFTVMFWSILMHRKSRGRAPARFHQSTWVEIVWTLVPLAILIAMAIPATQTLREIYDPRDAAVDIKITGYQWKWRYEYMGQGVDYFSNLATPAEQIQNREGKNADYLLEVDEPLVLPVGQKVRLLLTSADVIHSWWVPALAVKKDAVPGFINEAWTQIDRPGIYRGQCAELCGKDHGFMPVVVRAVEAEEFERWLVARQAAAEAERELSEKQWSLDELMSRGEAVYSRSCAACHQVDGSGLPPAFPALKGSAVATGPLSGHVGIVMNGKNGTAMQAFGEQLSPVDLAAVITYERNAWGNAMNEAVTPQAIVHYLQQGQLPEPAGSHQEVAP